MICRLTSIGRYGQARARGEPIRRLLDKSGLKFALFALLRSSSPRFVLVRSCSLRQPVACQCANVAVNAKVRLTGPNFGERVSFLANLALRSQLLSLSLSLFALALVLARPLGQVSQHRQRSNNNTTTAIWLTLLFPSLLRSYDRWLARSLADSAACLPVRLLA